MRGKLHRVFLSRQAVELLRQVREISGHGEYVLPSIFRAACRWAT
jgi:integrase